jgi:hypothetical protein
MKRIKAVVGLMVLSGLCLCAIAASNASAMTLHECTEKAANSTATEFTSSTCVTKGKGNFRTTPTTGKKQFFPTLTETTFAGTEGETNGAHAVLHATAGGVSFQITCTGIGSGGVSFVENKEVGGEMVFEGTDEFEFNGCAVKGTLAGKCTVPGTLRTELLAQTVVQNFLGMWVVFKQAAGGNFMVIPIEGASCPAAFKGKKPVTGEAVGTVFEGEPSISFNLETGNKLKLGELEAQFTAKIHFGTSVGGTPLVAETP